MTTNSVSTDVRYENVGSAMTQIGAAIAKSQIFGCQNVHQGEILALECITRGLPPLSLAEKYDIINGKLSMKSDAMLAAYQDAGGKYQIVEYSTDACEVVFSHGESKLAIRITWEDAQKESWPYKGSDRKELKHNWASPIGRQDMLWARVVSRGVRRLAPGVVCGRYTPEEIQDFSPQPQPAALGVGQDVSDSLVPEEAPINEATDVPADQSAEDAEFEVKTTGTDDDIIDQTVETSLKSAINQAVQLGASDMISKVRAVLANAGVEKLADLTYREANLLRSAIDKRSLEIWLEKPLRDSAKNDSSQS